jgi:two-component system sensor histidine kinase/response regulator
VMIELNNTQLQEQNHHLYVLNNEKNELMGIAAHDLKNPLASIRLMADMMLRYESRLDNEERREYLQNVLTASERMMAITSNILEINALEEGGIEFHCIPVNIVPITQTCVQDFLQRAEQKKLGLYCTAPNSAYAIADTQAVHQILDNLVSNAVKYSPHGKNIFVRVKASNEAVRVEVQDEGEGISPDDMKKLFGKFVRLSARPTGGEHSTGLGLSIVKKMVEAMNGRVWCESEVGKGATFIVELPKASEESHA